MMNNLILEYLKRLYVTSEVTSGEFIHTVTFPNNLGGDAFTKVELINGIQSFLDWDESPETFDLVKIGNYWYTTRHNFDDWVEYRGVRYPVKTVNVLIDCEEAFNKDKWVHTYQIAPECLIDAMQEDGTDGYLSDDEDEEGYEVDSTIYHYIEDEHWDLSLEVICKKHLDLPMTLIPDEDEA